MQGIALFVMIAYGSMTTEQYLQDVLGKKGVTFDKTKVTEVARSDLLLRNKLKPIIEKQGIGYIDEIFQTGSIAKGTAIKGKSDHDIFISVNHSCENSIEEIFNCLFDMCSRGMLSELIEKIFNCLKLPESFGKYNVRKQNVSVGIKSNCCNIDLVPGKRQQGHTNIHCIYKSKQNSWMQTNVKAQVEHVRKSECMRYIQLAKIWRDCHNLEFPSVNIEYAVLEALKDRPHNIPLTEAFAVILQYFANLKNARLVDISNSNNVISDDMTEKEKQKVADCAIGCLSPLEKIIW